MVLIDFLILKTFFLLGLPAIGERSILLRPFITPISFPPCIYKGLVELLQV